MFEQQKEFRKVIENKDSKAVEECAAKFICPVIVLDGSLPVEQNLERIMKLLHHSLEGYGFIVSELAVEVGIRYNNGKNTVT